jgi:Na+-driven multidrug efflux pump
LAAGAHYLHVVGPLYGFFALGLLLFFASQGAGQLLWPVMGNVSRLACAGLGGWIALTCGFGLIGVFMAQGAGMVIYGIINAVAVAGGAWFGPIGWPRSTTLLLDRVRAMRRVMMASPR